MCVDCNGVRGLTGFRVLALRVLGLGFKIQRIWSAGLMVRVDRAPVVQADEGPSRMMQRLRI